MRRNQRIRHRANLPANKKTEAAATDFRVVAVEGISNAEEDGMANSPNLNTAAIALNRFGLGARAGDTPPADPKAWLLAQFEQYQARPAAWASQPDSVALSTELMQQRMQFNQQARQNTDEGAATRTANAQNIAQPDGQTSAHAATAQNMTKPDGQTRVQANSPANAQAAAQSPTQTNAQTARQAERKVIRREILDLYRSSVNERVTSALTTQTPFIERLVHFWANTSRSPPKSRVSRRWPARSRLRRFARMCWAVLKTCWWQSSAIRPCSCFSIRRARSDRTAWRPCARRSAIRIANAA
jgi:uncharacterized protein (DUF1800 family)